MTQHDVIIIGAGLAGLSCALELKAHGLTPLLLEASDDVGGRVRTDKVEGFLLDRGFQVLLTAYPEARRLLDYDALTLCPFHAGAKVRVNKRFETISDPFRDVVGGLSTALGATGTTTLLDKLKIAVLRLKLMTQSREALYTQGSDTETLQWLRQQGFSERIIKAFFRPFYGGVLLDRDLGTSSKMLELTYKFFAEGDTVIPAHGIGQIPLQMAHALGTEHIRTQSPVARIDGTHVHLEHGEVLHAKDVVLATDLDWASTQHDALEADEWMGVTCVYYDAPKPPVSQPILVLNGEDEGPVNNLCVPSQISPFYAPEGRSLVSVSVVGDDSPNHEVLDIRIRRQMVGWFGAEAAQWRHLRTYHIPKAQPVQHPGRLTPAEKPAQLDEHMFVCGDHREVASIDGAMHSGARAARALINARG